MGETKERVAQFDILVRSEGSGEIPNVENIDRFKPPPERIERCRRWLVGQGVTAHATDFGLACSAPAGLFERLFQTTLEAGGSSPGEAPLRATQPPQPPQDIASDVEQVTLTVPPELF